MDTREAVARALAYLDAGCDKQRFSDEHWRLYLDDADTAIAAHLQALKDAGWKLMPPPEPAPVDIYRVRGDWDGWHPEMYHHIKGGAQWVPLNAQGMWADPECYNTGLISMRPPIQEQADAERAIERARRINAGRAMIQESDNG